MQFTYKNPYPGSKKKGVNGKESKQKGILQALELTDSVRVSHNDHYFFIKIKVFFV